MKRAVRVKVGRFSEEIAFVEFKLEADLFRNLEEALRTSIATDVIAVRWALHKFFNSNREDCVARSRVCALRREWTKAV